MRSIIFLFIFIVSAPATACFFDCGEENDCKQKLSNPRPPPFDCATDDARIQAEDRAEGRSGGLQTVCSARELYSPRSLWDLCNKKYGAQYGRSQSSPASVVKPTQVVAQEPARSSPAKKAADMNRGLPTMMDPQTMLTRVDVEGIVTNYYLTMVNYPSNTLDHTFLAKSQEIIGRRNCADSDIKVMYDHDHVMKYIISGSDKKQVGSFIISKVYCQRFK